MLGAKRMTEPRPVSHAETSQAPRLQLSGAVLLTGATGFLGVHLLRDALALGAPAVTCLLRAENAEAGKDALLRKLGWYFPEVAWPELERRIRVVTGDITVRQFGLRGRAYDELADGHVLVINAAASVSHVGRQADFFRINTDSVATLIELCQRGVPKALHHVSTVGVTGHFSSPPQLSAFTEEHLEEGQAFANPYGESKYRAELLMRSAFQEGLAGAVYRVGFIGPHSQSGRFQQNIHQNDTSRYVRACVRLGLAPYLPHSMVELTPVDSVARALFTLAADPELNGKTFHIENPSAISQHDVVRTLQAAGYPIRLLTMDQFVDRLPRLSQDEESLTVMLSGVRGGPRTYGVPLGSSFSQQALQRRGFEYPRLTSAWLGKFLQHAIEVGFIEAPRFWNVAPVVPDLL
jgi:thioester reductase-like protein